MTTATPIPLNLSNLRYWHSNAKLAIRSIHDALIELVTNSDDEYERLKTRGRIEIEVERRRGESPNLVRIRDFGGGMTAEAMKKKLARVGDRVSGMAAGLAVRGANSRGAKDVAVLGKATFESIASDGQYHKCEITAQGSFLLYPSRPVDDVDRETLRIRSGTGTLVTLAVSSGIAPIPQHETLKDQLSSLVVLRDILGTPDRQVLLRDLNKKRTDPVTSRPIEGREVLSETFTIPRYPGATAKLLVKHSPRRLDTSKPAFREGGIVIKSTRAIHEATYLASELEHDPYAGVFFGRLTCDYIEKLWNEYDDRFEQDLPALPLNPRPPVDPTRRGGLDRDHPFVKALFGEALRRFRPLVEAERKQHENTRADVESRATRQRLRTLEREAAKFMDRHREEDEAARDPNDRNPDGAFRQKGFSLSPPFAQVILGESRRFWLNIDQSAFPEISVGEIVEITCGTNEISANKRLVLLEPHPTQEKVLRALWLVKGEKVSPATSLTARVGPIIGESTVEVLGSERDKYRHVTDLCFSNKRYSVRVDGTRSIAVFAPFPGVVSKPTSVKLNCSSGEFKFSGDPVLIPKPELGVALCKIRVKAAVPEKQGILTARLDERHCEAQIISIEPHGSGITIKLEDVDHGNQRYRWKGNVLEIATRHPSLKRYLGPPKEFPGQEQAHFRVLLAEIVADAVCSRVISRNELGHPDDYKDYDWDAFYAEYSSLLTEFLPIAHASQLKDPPAT